MLPFFRLRLEDTYWTNGFFNVNVDCERFLTTKDGPIEIQLPTGPIAGRISRGANKNTTPRVFGKRPLAQYFQSGYRPGELVTVEIVSLTKLAIR